MKDVLDVQIKGEDDCRFILGPHTPFLSLKLCSLPTPNYRVYGSWGREIIQLVILLILFLWDFHRFSKFTTGDNGFLEEEIS